MMKYLVEKAYREMLEREPDCFFSYVNLGRFLRNTGRVDEAEKVLRKGLELAGTSEDYIDPELEECNQFLANIKHGFAGRVSAGTSEYQADVMVNLLKNVKFKNPEKAKILDIGSGWGDKVYAVAKSMNVPTQNVTCVDYEEDRYTKRFFTVHKVDLETGTLPLKDEEFDLVICNQVLEHLKNIETPLTEMHRVLKSDGHLLVGTPNLTAAYNKISILLGKQPTVIKLDSEHVRGFAHHGLKTYLEKYGFRVVGSNSNGFYPFPIEIGRHLTRIFPTQGIFMYFLAQKG